MAFKNVVILGSTGSIGVNALKVIEGYPHIFRVVGLSAYNSIKLLEKQIKKFEPKYAAAGEQGIKQLAKSCAGTKTKFLNVDTDLEDLVARKDVDIVVIGMRGSAALGPFLSAVRAGKRVAPANKEALVIAGELLMEEARKHKATIILVDSEQSAIFQCLDGQKRDSLKKVYLTASGGALRNVPKDHFDRLSVKEILNHPRWKMGDKITVDSATLMNKGFEVIEALRLFNLSIEQIEVVVHPEAIIHSMVEYCDGSILAQLGTPDMRLPIQYALTYPDRWSTNVEGLDFFQLKQLNFEKPDLKKFPSLSLAYHVAK
ncbi:MAG: 1-deoxy-D-xylulose-5-phosphate reductoisomerase [Candidatus Omnitrophica bacterium]|nr:1-deoxy-D-xylulose-5-phosphate reductoisomerase [Candidatus Omnitrophota bacterium]